MNICKLAFVNSIDMKVFNQEINKCIRIIRNSEKSKRYIYIYGVNANQNYSIVPLYLAIVYL